MSETQVIRVRYWAAARSAAGVAEDTVDVAGPMTLADVVAEVVRRRAPSAGPRFEDVIAVCSVLVGARLHDLPVAVRERRLRCAVGQREAADARGEDARIVQRWVKRIGLRLWAFRAWLQQLVGAVRLCLAAARQRVDALWIGE